MTQFPQQTIEDSDFGMLHYHIDAWDGDIDLDCPPLAEAHIHFVAGESGSTEIQFKRTALLELIDRHASLWPEVSRALIRCHPELKQVDDLNERIDPRIGINMYDNSSIELTFQFAGDPEYRAYFVTLRDWSVTEVCAAD